MHIFVCDGKRSGATQDKPIRGNHCSLDPLTINKILGAKTQISSADKALSGEERKMKQATSKTEGRETDLPELKENKVTYSSSTLPPGSPKNVTRSNVIMAPGPRAKRFLVS
jgi:hypothetical protein